MRKFLSLVLTGRLELPRPCGHSHLKAARIPIPPRQQEENSLWWSRLAEALAKAGHVSSKQPAQGGLFEIKLVFPSASCCKILRSKV